MIVLFPWNFIAFQGIVHFVASQGAHFIVFQGAVCFIVFQTIYRNGPDHTSSI